MVLSKVKLSKTQKNYTDQLFKTLKNKKNFSSFKDNIWDANPGDIQLISKYNKKICFVLCLIDIHL